MSTIADFKPLDRYAHGLSQERPRVPWLGTMSAGYKDKAGVPVVSRRGDERWIHLSPQDQSNAPGLLALVKAGGYRWIDVALPFEDPSLFLQQRFERRSASRLEVFGDEHELTVLGVPDRAGKQPVRQRVHPGDAQWDTLAESCSVSVSLFFVPARWTDEGNPQIFFTEDGLGVYRCRFTSRNSLRELHGSLLEVAELTGGKVSGLPLRLGVQFREVADPQGARREVPIWTLRFRAPGGIELTLPQWSSLKQKSLAEGELLRALPAPLEETPDTADEAFDMDDEVSESALDALRQGPPADAKFYEASWFTRVRGSHLDTEAARAQFVSQFTSGRTDSLATFLKSATEGQAAALLVAAAEAVAAQTPKGVRQARAARYADIFPEEDLVVQGDRVVNVRTGEVVSEESEQLAL